MLVLQIINFFYKCIVRLFQSIQDKYNYDIEIQIYKLIKRPTCKINQLHDRAFWLNDTPALHESLQGETLATCQSDYKLYTEHEHLDRICSYSLKEKVTQLIHCILVAFNYTI